MDIDGWRIKIDTINEQLVKLINERTTCALEIGKLKKKEKLPVHDPQRENNVYNHITRLNQGPLSNEALQRIFSFIIEENRKIQD
jgi:chorismate mutase-like protein